MSAVVQEIIQLCEAGFIDTKDFEAACRSEGMPPADIADAVALEVAKRFISGQLSFSDASAVLNTLYHPMLECAPQAMQAQAIYDAFDAGEAAGIDEVVSRKMLNELLAGV